MKQLDGEALPDAKLTIKVGESEVYLEARPEIVRQELDRLMDRLLPAADPIARDPVVVSVTAPRDEAEASAASPTPAEEGGIEKRGTEKPATALDFIVQARGRQALKPGVEKLLQRVTISSERLAELYGVDPRGRIFLKKLPATRDQLRDTVLLLIYGALTMRGETSESGYRLVQGVRSMGVRIARVPRELGPGGELATSFGRYRSKRYRLTPDGISYCEQLIPGLLQALSG